MSRSNPSDHSHSDEDKPEKPTYAVWVIEPTDWPGKLYKESELLMMGEGDYDSRLDGDWNKQHEPKDNQ